MTPWVVIMCALLALAHGLWPYFALLFLPILISSYPGFVSNCDLYEAALPIEARALWLSQVASRLALLWLPILAATAVLAIRGDRLPYLLAGASVWTVAILVVKRYRIREFSAPQWVRLGATIVPFAAFALHRRVHLDVPGGPVHAGIVLASCGLASAALFLSGWLAVPKTFQIAPVRPRASRRGRLPPGPLALRVVAPSSEVFIAGK